MQVVQQQVRFEPSTYKLRLFEEVYPESAAKAQAEKKKLNAFGMLAKLNPLKRPKDDTVLLSRHELRLEPFWHITARRSVDFTRDSTYTVPVQNPYVQSVDIDGTGFEVSHSGDKRRIDIPVRENCHRKMATVSLLDGLKRTIRPSTLEGYLTKYKYHDIESLDRRDITKPVVPPLAAMQQVQAQLNGEAIDATELQLDVLEFEAVHLYLRPVFAFEFLWSEGGRSATVEVDGLTGEVHEDGQWFKDKLSDPLTREMLVEFGSELAGAAMPGAATIVKYGYHALAAPRKSGLDHPAG